MVVVENEKKKSEEEPVCKRCGLCCYLRTKNSVRKCRYLIFLSSGKTVCRIYKTRLGKKIGSVDGQNFVCKLRKNVHLNYEGCPYNKPGLPMVTK